MTGKTKKLLIVGAGEFGSMAYEYFSFDSCYEVVAFAEEKKYKSRDELYGKPVIELEKIEDFYSKEEYYIFVAITYPKLNQIRTRIYGELKKKGYRFASYISSAAFVWHNVEVGENTFIFENNTIQYNVKIGNNVVLWSGNHVGHGTIIGNNCWITSHDVISGFCKIGNNCFLGVNATVGDYVEIADDVVLGAGSVTVKSLKNPGMVYYGSPAKENGRTSYQQFEMSKEEMYYG